ncbi:WhiB family transcriptional regulator [Streptomyces sp. OF3]|uniref:WhiB family transcriptional regulator n=1 Tax=Streptomyces alkaliterrae TaxID=2213162 RepID=A0A7W3WIB6_9ACTN|nr:WhiB family transcriptional regulator [Streptomyces alkaliterrae]MBB1252886.1 WhiB family transcriptional regulator [Streptomyces alkaliterrae]
MIHTGHRDVGTSTRDDDHWTQRAACAGTYDGMTAERTEHANIRLARAVCAACPVREPCLADALAAEGLTGPGQRWGVRGGLTPRERWHRRHTA